MTRNKPPQTNHLPLKTDHEKKFSPKTVFARNIALPLLQAIE